MAVIVWFLCKATGELHFHHRNLLHLYIYFSILFTTCLLVAYLCHILFYFNSIHTHKHYIVVNRLFWLTLHIICYQDIHIGEELLVWYRQTSHLYMGMPEPNNLVANATTSESLGTCNFWYYISMPVGSDKILIKQFTLRMFSSWFFLFFLLWPHHVKFTLPGHLFTYLGFFRASWVWHLFPALLCLWTNGFR